MDKYTLATTAKLLLHAVHGVTECLVATFSSRQLLSETLVTLC